MKKTILLAEDDKKTALALTLRLESAGYEVLAVADGFRSFMAAVGRKPDLILMDICMPFGEGFFVADELRKVDLGRIPIIFMTASKKESFLTRAQEIGAAGFFRKPFDSHKLLAAIDRVINAQRSPSGSASLDSPARPPGPEVRN